MLEIITTPNPILLKKSEQVRHFNNKLVEIIDQMKQTLDATVDPIGVGLAAPQVAISLRIFLVKPKQDGKTHVFINPKILSVVEDLTPGEKKRRILEGCLSVPTIWGKVKRKKAVTVEYQDIHGKIHTRTFRGFLATIMQHETDHLDGILFTKHIVEQGEKLYKSHKDENGEDVFDEVKL